MVAVGDLEQGRVRPPGDLETHRAANRVGIARHQVDDRYAVLRHLQRRRRGERRSVVVDVG